MILASLRDIGISKLNLSVVIGNLNMQSYDEYEMVLSKYCLLVLVGLLNWLVIEFR